MLRGALMRRCTIAAEKGRRPLVRPLLRLRGVAYFGGKVLAIPADQKSAARILRPH
jgi:hypothetical protein